MKKKLLGIFVYMLLIVTALPAVGTMNEKEIPASFGICSNSSDQQITKQTTMTGDRGSLFIQLPTDDLIDDWRSYVSDTGANWKTYDDFWEISSEICDIHWWGQCLIYTDDWHSYDPTGMTVQIQFYDDDNGQPGTLLYSYDSVNPSITETGIMYHYAPGDEYFELYYFETDLEPCCQVSNGWVSIQSTYCPSGGWFMWMYSPDGNKNMYQFHTGWINYQDDVSFILTDGEPTDPDLECDGELSWTDVKPGDTVTGDFVVRNNGDPDSILHWKIESYPNWGKWTFMPNASILTIGAGWLTVDVEVVAPDDPNEEFTGEIKLINAADTSDSCTIDVSLATPRNRAFNMNMLFLRFLENHPHMFPMLRHMLGL